MTRSKAPTKYLKQKAFQAVPLISVLAFLPALIISNSFKAKLVSVLGITSLISTAYILAFLPAQMAEPPSERSRKPVFLSKSSPVDRYLGKLNAGLSVLIAAYAFSFRNARDAHDGFWLLCLLPGREYGIHQ